MTALIFGFFCSAIIIAGGALVLARPEFTRKYMRGLLAFAAGVLVSTAIGAVYEEAQALTDYHAHAFLAGITLMYLLEAFFRHSHHFEGDMHGHGDLSLLAVAALIFHSAVDGFAIGIASEVSPAVEAAVIIGVVVHKLPEGVAAALLALNANNEKGAAWRLVALLAVATPLGVAAGLGFGAVMPGAEPGSVLGVALAGVAGSFCYVAFADLLPHVHCVRDLRVVAAFAVGCVLPFGHELFH